MPSCNSVNPSINGPLKKKEVATIFSGKRYCTENSSNVHVRQKYRTHENHDLRRGGKLIRMEQSLASSVPMAREKAQPLE